MSGLPRFFPSRFRLLTLLCVACLYCGVLSAAGREQKLAEYQRLSWLVGTDGLNGDPYSLTQGGDSYLWVGTSSGLFRFDGGRFRSWREDPGSTRLSDMILSLYRANDGSVWAAAEGVLYHVSGKTVEKYRPPKRMTFLLGMTEGAGGSILYGGKDLETGRWQLCSLHPKGPGSCEGIAEDGRASWIGQHGILYADGTTWVGVDTGVMRFRGNEKLMIPLPALAPNVNHYGVSTLLSDGHGGVLVGVIRAGRGLGLQHLVGETFSELAVPGIDTSDLQITAMARDTGNALWIGTADSGIYRVLGSQVEHFDAPQGLPGKYVTDLWEDHERSMWVSSRGGVTRFSRGVIVSVPNDQDFYSDEVDGVQVSSSGTLWVTGRGTLQSLRPGSSKFVSPMAIGVSQHTGSILEDHRGQVWVGIDNSLVQLDPSGKFVHVNYADGTPLGQIGSLAEDTDFNIWVAAEGPPQRTVKISPDRKRIELVSDLPPTSRVVSDPAGGVFLATLQGEVIHIDRNGNRRRLRLQATEPTVIRHLLVDANGTLLVATNAGLFVFTDGVGHLLDVRNGMPCNDHENSLFDRAGNLWIYTQCGLAKITKEDFLDWERDPSASVSPALFDAEDGALPARSLWNGAGITPDGTLWYAAGNRLQRVVPDAIREIDTPPVVRIEEFIADRQYFALDQPIHLPALTRDIQINYAGLSFVSSDKTQFRYQLEGFDPDWKDVGGRRQAVYTGLPPGAYRFHVTSRKSGAELWNPQEQVIDFNVAYAFYQTVWFRVLCVVAVGIALYTFFQLRLRSVARNVRMRQAVQHAERERIARELHDTFLQSVQGLIIKFGSLAKKIPREAPVRAAMESLLNDSDEVLREARSRIQNLREREHDTLRLPERVALLSEEVAAGDGIRADVTIHGEPYELSREAYDNIYGIVQEAIRNAGKHSKARKLEVELEYGDTAFRCTVRDDGVGMDDQTLRQGRVRHWGLLGMRERAKLLKGALNIVSRLNGGTEVELTASREALKPPQAHRGVPSSE